MTDRVFTGDLSEIPPFSYDLIMADPPWSFLTWSAKGHGKSAQRHYKTMTRDALNAMPVVSLAKPDCLIWLWCVNPMLPQALETLAAWSFTFKTAGHWVKWNAGTGNVAFGTGYILRSAGEPFLIGTIGKPKTSRSVRSVVMGPRREHSRKPEEAFAAAEALMPNARRIELFSRQPRENWDCWGDELEGKES